MNKKILSIAVITSLLPIFAIAAPPRAGMLVKGKEIATERVEKNENRKATTTTEKTLRRAAMEIEKQAKVKKLSGQTIENYNRLADRIEDLAKRTAMRGEIMFERGVLTPQEKTAVGAQLNSAKEMLTKVRTEISDLSNLSTSLIESEKPGQEVKALRKASNAVRDDIKTAHREVVRAIELIKSTVAKERRSASSTPERKSEGNKEQ
ncbi:MAG: hypothetical protein HZA94_01720 [Candidatus Vogelbacteria bacterium]|nr:hypothetical protein [Candidatus Vogelbacteria bacterium]